MKSLALPLKYGHVRWVTQHYGPKGWKVRPMVIPNCGRCLAVLIFWKPKNYGSYAHNVHSITAVHVPPYVGKAIKLVRNIFFKKLFSEMHHSEPYLIVMAGGLIDNPKNKVHYRRGIDNFVKPFIYRFPEIQRIASVPKEKTLQSTLVLTKELEMTVYSKIAK